MVKSLTKKFYLIYLNWISSSTIRPALIIQGLVCVEKGFKFDVSMHTSHTTVFSKPRLYLQSI